MYCLVDGHLLSTEEPALSALDRGFTLGDGIFETMRAKGNRIFRLDDHLARLRDSAATLELPLPLNGIELDSALRRTLQANGFQESAVRLTVSRGVARRGLLPDSAAKPSVVIQVGPLQRIAPQRLDAGYCAIVSSIRRNETSPLSRIKSCNYLDNMLARMEAARAGADEAVMLNCAGVVACCSAANVHIVSSGAVLTPAVAAGVLPGITRQAVKEIAGELGVQWREAEIDLTVVATAQEAFITNSLIGIVPLTSLEQRPIGDGRPGAITRLLAARYESTLALT